jgi:hypothetical protein
MKVLTTVVKIIGYGFAAFFILGGVAGDLSALALGVGLLALLLLATNAWGLRAHVPFFNSPQALHRRGANAALVLSTLLAAGNLPTQAPEQQRAEAQPQATAATGVWSQQTSGTNDDAAVTASTSAWRTYCLRRRPFSRQNRAWHW